MIDQSINLANKTEELLGILRRDAEHLEWVTSKLNELRGFVIKRDEKGLAELLDEIQAEAQDYSINEQNRSRVCEEIAADLGGETKKLTLSVLVNSINEPMKTILAGTQAKLKISAQRLSREYILTATLLKDCARINRLLLKAIFEGGRNNLVCYDSAGTTSNQQHDASFMSMRL